MFYEVRVLDRNMNPVKNIGSRQLARIFWSRFYREEKIKKFARNNGTKVPRQAR